MLVGESLRGRCQDLRGKQMSVTALWRVPSPNLVQKTRKNGTKAQPRDGGKEKYRQKKETPQAKGKDTKAPKDKKQNDPPQYDRMAIGETTGARSPINNVHTSSTSKSEDVQLQQDRAPQAPAAGTMPLPIFMTAANSATAPAVPETNGRASSADVLCAFDALVQGQLPVRPAPIPDGIASSNIGGGGTRVAEQADDLMSQRFFGSNDTASAAPGGFRPVAIDSLFLPQ
eukprot:SAG31_NODE_2832_length_5025_cov_4.096427_2_plen_229_part_00